MRLKFTPFLIAACIGFQANAQTWVTDSVSMGAQINPPNGPSYHEDVYYSLKNGQQKTSSNLDWEIAFQMTKPGPNGNVSVFANHAQAAVEVYSLHMSASSKFASLSASDTVGLTSNQLYNKDTSWNWGAFNVNTSGNIIDYGWGVYNITSHKVTGDTLYLVKVNGVPYKLWIQEYISTPADSVQYKFRIAKFDGTGDKTERVYMKNYPNRLFAYYDIDNGTFADRETGLNGWDLLFTRYIAFVSQGPGPLVPYPVMGIMSNNNMLKADVRNVNPDTTKYNNYLWSTGTELINEPGYDWKTFNNSTFKWELDTNATFYILSTNSKEIYQIAFTRFDGGSTGKTVFKKRKVADAPITSVNNIEQVVTSHVLVPNPASGRTDMLLTANEATNARMIITDITGKTMLNSPVRLDKGLNALGVDVSAYPTGTYVISVSDGNWQASEKMVVNH
ncbi:MAG: T9SS type A sorting domain-containing protein [Chitinophagales bacterium]|nr:T9SS type A sorting domain-containing protein [Chitinophagaceae bacterium]MCB9064076.1 T9SS type A sorting domain-containing protein [Chitinophagales bacterium]